MLNQSKSTHCGPPFGSYFSQLIKHTQLEPFLTPEAATLNTESVLGEPLSKNMA